MIAATPASTAPGKQPGFDMPEKDEHQHRHQDQRQPAVPRGAWPEPAGAIKAMAIGGDMPIDPHRERVESRQSTQHRERAHPAD
jgi:hypothetical protein